MEQENVVGKLSSEEIAAVRVDARRRLEERGYNLNDLKKEQYLLVDSLDDLGLAFEAGIPAYYPHFSGY